MLSPPSSSFVKNKNYALCGCVVVVKNDIPDMVKVVLSCKCYSILFWPNMDWIKWVPCVKSFCYFIFHSCVSLFSPYVFLKLMGLFDKICANFSLLLPLNLTTFNFSFWCWWWNKDEWFRAMYIIRRKKKALGAFSF